MTHQKDEPVHQQKTIEVGIQKIKRPIDRKLFGPAGDEHIEHEMKQDYCACEDNAQPDMKKYFLTPIVTIDAVTPRHPENQRRHQRPEITGRGLDEKGSSVGNRQ